MKNLYYCRVFQYLLLCAVTLCTSQFAKAQSISIDHSNFISGTYGQGSSVAVPFTTSGCFSSNNTFELYLSDASGDFTNEQLLSSQTSVYAAFLNGSLPAALPPGTNYRLRIKSTAPVIVSGATNVITVAASATVVARVNALPSRILEPQKTFGWCTNIADNNVLMLLNQSTLFSTVSAKLINNVNGAVTTPSFSPILNGWNLTLGQYYYTFIVKSELGGITSTRAYTIANSPNQVGLSTFGQQSGCLPDTLQFTVVIDPAAGGIGNNFPTTKYRVNWGDGTIDTFSHCDLVSRAGIIKHLYQETSCNQGETSSFNVSITLLNPFQSTSPSVTCDQPIVQSAARVFRRPESNFNLPAYGCINTPMLIENTTSIGLAQGPSNVCVATAYFTWLVDGQLVYQSPSPEGLVDITHTFTTPGEHIVRLDVDNGSCGVDTYIDTICIETAIQPSFTINGGDSISGCAPLSFTVTNTSPNNPCRDLTYQWTVLNADGTPASATAYTVDALNIPEPSFTFDESGRYRLRLTLQNSCGGGSVEKFINVFEDAAVILPTDKARCDTAVIDFATNLSHRPSYSTNIGSEVYSWTITGGAFSFDGGTTQNSPYPKIRFTNYGTYTVKVDFTNECGTASDTQLIRFDAPVDVNLLVPATPTICFNQDTIALNASFSGPVNNIQWNTTGNGTYNNATIVNPVYTFGNSDRNNRYVKLYFTAFPAPGSACAAASDTVFVTIKRRNVGVDSLITICSNTAVNYTPASSILSSSFTWTSALLTGSVTGLTASGSGVINDVLVNNSTVSDAIVKYTITPFADGCIGSPFTLTVTVKPLPDFTIAHPEDTICSNQPINIQLNSSAANVKYAWSSVVNSGTVSGNSNQLQPVSVAGINDVLVNTGTSIAEVIYTITVEGNGNCEGATQEDTIYVRPAVTTANAGVDQQLCAQSSTTLAADNPVMGNGTWTQIEGPAVTIVSPNQYNTVVNDLASDTSFVFVWNITDNGSCSASSDTVIIYNRSNVTEAQAGNDVVICDFSIQGNNSVQLTANSNLKIYETGSWQFLSNPTGSNPTLGDNNDPGTSLSFDKSGLYELEWMIQNAAGCAVSRDTIVIRVFDQLKAGTIAVTSLSACAGSDVTFTLQDYVGVITKWQYNPKPINDDIWIDTLIANNVIVFNNVADTFSVRAIVGSSDVSVCSTAVTAASITMHVAPVTIGGNTNSDTTVCADNNEGAVVLTNYTGTIIRWETSLDSGATWQTISSNNNLITYTNLNATTWYRAIVRSGACSEAISDTTIVTVQSPILSNNVIGTDQSICYNTAASIITGEIPAGGDGNYIYQWEKSIDSTNWEIIVTAVSKDYTPGVITQTIYYRRKITALLCTGEATSLSNVVTVVVNPNAKAEYSANKTQACPPFTINNSIIQVTEYGSKNSQYLWFVNDNFIGTGTVFPGYTMQAGDDSIAIKLKTTSLYGCENDSIVRNFYTFPMPNASFTASDTMGCGPLTVNFTNTTVNLDRFSYHWDFGNGQTSTAAHPNPIIFVLGSNHKDTIYIVRLYTITDCDTVDYTINIRVRAKPKAIFAPSKTFGCSPLTVSFNNTSLGSNTTYTWNFGDGHSITTASTTPVEHTFHTAQKDTFYVKLLAENECGKDSMQYAIIISPNTIKLDFVVSSLEAAGCAPHAVNFINNSQGATSFIWEFGDGETLTTTANIETINHLYNQAGNYTVKLRAMNGCSDTTDLETVTVFAKPQAAFTALPSSICIGDSVHFTNHTDTLTTALWKFGDNTSSGLLHPTHSYALAGIYDVKMIAIRHYVSGNICSDSIAKKVTVVATLPGTFTISDSIGKCLPFVVNLANQNTASASTTWSIGDSTIATGNTVSYTFTQPGNYIIKMKALDPGGCIYEATKEIKIQSPNGTWEYSNDAICGSGTVQFKVTANNADSVKWNFGDGSIVTTTAFTTYHTYTKPGKFLPEAELISGNAGCKIPLQIKDSIKVDKITAGFTNIQERLCDSTRLYFKDTSHSVFGIKQLQWNFGTVGSSTQSNPIVTYTNTNTWPLQLIAISNAGCADTINILQYVKVNNTPVANIIGDGISCTNTIVHYNAEINSTDTVNFYNWNFSNNVTSHVAAPVNNYFNAGNYTAKLIVGTKFGCYDTTYHTIQINPSPALVASNDVLICKSQTIALKASGAESYSWWSSGNLSCTTCAEVWVTPATTTSYIVTGTNQYGCSSKDSILITVGQPINVTVSNNDSICIGQTSTLIASGAHSYNWHPATGLDKITGSIVNASPANHTQYRVIGNDEYGCFSDTAYVNVSVSDYPSIELDADKVLATGTQLTLMPSIINGPVTQWQWQPSTNLSCNTCMQPVATVKNNICYTVDASNDYGCADKDTICIRTFCESAQVFIPNAFTPDNDGINDILLVRGQGIKRVKSFRIYNRWGQMVFERANYIPNGDVYNGWDGKIKGQAAPPDVYVYTCEVVCENDTPYTYKGNVAIIK